jgi:hypothetical protein
MAEYEEQIEAGKRIVREMLTNFAVKLGQPKVNDLRFKVTDGDFDSNCVSLIDAAFNIIAKIKNDDLADCPADVGVRRTLEIRLEEKIRATF